ncbi:RNA-binding protein 12B [Panthera pardus]|uniref:RNA-binding protein 12B n=1 Tax=Panthera pardus TaxID=9691 RepID=A0A9V1FVA3_PANPR|nr:RNA-binding protein 12B [Panthera pardus]XP_019309001.1 RNA-binding protein 12B [Panthera pardus]XP_019309002.1 RNA-binding protein 12B [Panthera pardus]XP_019309004.1 RNA-binding protein 12B [Panthera pardus]XP_019309005.1 RNA-binding protein 12B [Panthera pardus]XP_042780121.1 RNA-binding protein 12B [Panthera leo]XP_042780122.1 RNA-binding protein 12B [Panthera leo]XP_042780123.1 RNA-binding protein 12B [Panthera leo]XP_042780124.1 RNA-binding protein 12B [Panthera leo]XP_042780125.1
MAVVIRLLGLPFIAGPVDIRHFFTGLTIPDGGVHIIGGEVGEAFIIFATDEDARRAISRSGGFIKDSSVELFLSSKAEMQKTIEMKRTDRIGRERPGSGASGAGSLSNFVEAIKEEASNSGYGSPINQDAGFHTNGTGHGDLRPRKTRPLKAENPYLFLRGLPYLVNEDDVRVFFSGLCVDGVIFLKHHDGRNNGDAIVKFASCIDASGGLKCHRSFMGSRFIEVMQGSEQQWIEFGGNAIKEVDIPMRTEEHSPPRGINDRHFRKRSHSKSPRRTRSRSPLGFYVHLKNLSLSINKRDLRNFFRDTDLTNEQIRFLYKDERRTRYAFVMFKTLKDYNTALGLHKTVLQYRPVHIDPVSRKQMLKFIECYEKKRPVSIEKERLGHISQKYSQEGYPGQKLCIYIRNFPFDVTKVEVQKFFADFSLAEDDIYLLYDDKGVGLGEALVKFKSEEQAMKAERLNRRRFLGTEVLLRLISEAQMQEFDVNFSLMSSERVQDHSQSRDRDDHSHSFDSSDPPIYSVGPSENFRHQQEDLRQLDNFKQTQGDFRQLDRSLPEDFRRSPEDFRRSPEDFRRPREEHFRRPLEDFRRPLEEDFRRPWEDFRYPREEDFRYPREEEWRRAPEEDFRRPSKEDFRRPLEEDWRRLPEEDWRRPPEGDFRRPLEEDWRRPPEDDFRRLPQGEWRRPPEEDFRRLPEEDFRRPPEEDFRRPPEEDFRRSPEEDFRRSPEEDFRRPPQEHFRRPAPEHLRRPPPEHFRRPPPEHFRRPPQEHFRRPPQEHFRRPPQEHFRRPPQEHLRRPREEDFRHPPDEDFRGLPDEDLRHPPDEDFRSPQEEDFRCPSDEDFRRLPEEDLREPPEEDPRLPDSFRPPGEEFRSPPDDFRSHRPFVNFGRPEGGKFDFGKRSMGSFPEGRFMPDPKLNCSSGRLTPIKIMNLPFKANVNEILDFFHGYRIIPDSVSIQYNEQGLPTGEAIVAMINYNEAMAAIKDLSDRPVGPRKVKLMLL